MIDLRGSEFVRPRPPGLRELGTGVVMLARQLGLAWTLTKKDMEAAAALTPEEAQLEQVALTWLLDERNSIAEIKAAAARGREQFFAELQGGDDGGYAFTVPIVLMTLATAELKATNAALEAAMYAIEKKPDEREGPQPAGKSSSQPG